MTLSLINVLKIMKGSINNKGNKISTDAKVYLAEKTEEFIRNVTKNSLQFTIESKRKTIFKSDISKCLDSLSLILKNMPKSNESVS